MVGRVTNGKERVLTNIIVGNHEVSARDSSGHEIYRIVRVERNRIAMVSLKLPKLVRSADPYHLVFLGKNDQGYEEYRREMDEAVVVKIPAGEFLMGNPETEGKPLEHKVHVSVPDGQDRCDLGPVQEVCKSDGSVPSSKPALLGNVPAGCLCYVGGSEGLL